MFEKDGNKLEKFIRKKMPLLAKAKKEPKKYDSQLAEYFANDDWRKFDGVVFLPDKNAFYCSFYDETKKVAVLVHIIDMKFQNIEIQKKVTRFLKKYY